MLIDYLPWPCDNTSPLTELWPVYLDLHSHNKVLSLWVNFINNMKVHPLSCFLLCDRTDFVWYFVQRLHLWWFPSTVLRIPTAHDFRVITVHKWVRARAQHKRFPTSKAQQQNISLFSLKRTWWPIFLLHIIT